MREVILKGDWQEIIENLFVDFIEGKISEIHIKETGKNEVHVKYM